MTKGHMASARAAACHPRGYAGTTSRAREGNNGVLK